METAIAAYDTERYDRALGRMVNGKSQGKEEDNRKREKPDEDGKRRKLQEEAANADKKKIKNMRENS